MRKKQFHIKPICASLALAFVAQAATTHTAHANPVGAAVANGQASFATAGKTLTVTNTPGTIINWQGFSIGANEITRFAQQSASSAVLNRVIANNPSNILGSLQSNGRVFLVNPNGIVFGAGSTVNVAGMVASTLNLSNADFIAGRYNFTNTPGAHNISNAGSITAAHGDGQRGGQIYLIAPNVENTGVINAPNGEILLAAGHSVELVNSNDPNLRVNITAPAGDATNVGQLVASSGSLGLFGAVVKNSGTVSANSATLQGGKIVFKASQRVDAGGTISAQGVGGGSIAVLADMQSGTVNVTGTLDASSIAPLSPSPSPARGEGSTTLPSPLAGEGLRERGNSTNGGQIETSAAHVNIADTARVTTAAAACTEPCLSGLAGTWLIDPFDFTIAATGGNITGAALTANLAGGNISILSTNGTTGTLGNVNVNDIVTWSANKLTLNAQNNININANLNGSGTASLALEYGQVSAGGGTSTYNVNAAVNLPAGNNFSTKLGSTGAVTNYTVITSLGAVGSVTAVDLQGMNGGLAGNYALGSNIDASATSAWNVGAGFAPVGNTTTQFTGTFDGLGHTISNLFINLPTTNGVGLFGYAGTSSVIRNVGLVGGSVSGSNYVGALVGWNNSGGTISNSYATGSASGTVYVGGLVGGNWSTISNSYATGSVIGASSSVGGLVGWNNSGGAISNSYATGSVSASVNMRAGGLVGFSQGTISNSYATGNVSGGVEVGGLVGYGQGTISNSYATGNVSGATAYIGGLVGNNWSTISNSYATGNVSGGDQAGGLIGHNVGNISNSYATGSTSGTTYVGGLVGWSSAGTTVSNSYATGSASGVVNVGGLVGGNYGTVSNSHWNSTVIATGIGAGTTTGTNVSGLTSVAMQTAANFTGFVFTTTPGATGNNWVMVDADGTLNNAAGAVGATRPMLASEYSTTINNAHQLQLMRMALGASYTLSANIDAAKTANSTDVWGSSGFVPVGNVTTNFTGTFDGLGHTVSNLFINLPTTNGVGLFGYAGTGSVIRNVGLVGGSVIGSVYVGELVGYTSGGTVSNSYATGSVTGTGNVGGLVGYSRGTVSNSYATGSVSGTGTGSTIGGLVGLNYGTVSTSYATGNVSSTGNNVGGLVGYNYLLSTTTNSYATGSVSGAGTIGGLVGANICTISNSYATGSVSGTGTIGGLVGWNNNGGTISNSYAMGSVTGTSSSVGGLVGANACTISNSYATGSVSGITYVGGLVGYTWGGTVSNSHYNINAATINGGHNATRYGLYNDINNDGGTGQFTDWLTNYQPGGLPLNIANYATLLPGGGNSYTIGSVQGMKALLGFADNAAYTFSLTSNIDLATVSGLNIPYFSGIFDGQNHTISNPSINLPNNDSAGLFGTAASGSTIRNVGLVGGNVSVSGSGNSHVGVLVGQNYGTVSNSYATGSVSGTGRSAGGLVGANNGTVNNSYATANVSGSNLFAGGLVGINGGTISNSYAMGSASGTSYVGGLVGYTSIGTISNSYSTGSVSGGSTVGGLVGSLFSGTVTNSFWNTTTSGQTGSAGGTGKTTAQMQTASSLTGFNFTATPGATGNNWVIVNADGTLQTNASATAGATYPMLASEYSTTINNAHQLQLMQMASAASYTLGSNIDASKTATSTDVWGSSGFVPIGNSGTKFTGTFDGLGHTISNLTINRPTTNYIGLFGYTNTGSIIRNVGLVGGSVSGASYVGGLVGAGIGVTISNSYTTGNVSGASNTVGGLAAFSDGTVSNSYATGNVSGASGNAIGGLVGNNYGTVSNSYATGNVSVTASTYVGGLVGRSIGTISNSYATGSVTTGNALYVGGLMGNNTATGTVSNSYATGSVSGTGRYFGGLMGNNSGAVSNSYATGSVGSTYVSGWIGGLMGVNNTNATISNSYATGSVTGTGANVGGLMGMNYGGTLSLSNNFWNTTTSGRTTGIGGAGAVQTGSTGLTTAQMMQFSSFSSWNTATPNTIANTGGSGAVWRIYEGHTAPLLTSFMTPLTLTGAPDATVTYNGSAQSGAAFTLITNVLGAAATGTNAGFYNGYYSNQQGYDLSGGNLTISPAALSAISLNGTRAYDGTANVNANIFTLSGLVGGQTLTLSGTGTVADKNVGVNKPVTLGTLALGNGTNGGLASNYTFTGGTQVATITAAAITLSTGNVSKTYDGLLTAAGVAAVTGGTLFGGDSISGGSFAFTDKNVGSGNKIVTASGITVNDGNGGGNYSVTYTNNTTSTITAAALTVTANAAAKTYDGLAYSGGNGVAYTGLVNGEISTVLGGVLAYGGTSQGAVNAGSYLITPGGLTSGNYTIGYVDGALTINAAALSAISLSGTRAYDGTANVNANIFTLSGLVGGQTLTLSGTGTVADKNVGVNKPVTLGSLALGDGTGLASNYTFTGGTQVATITAAPLTLSTSAVSKTYDGLLTAAGVAAVTGGTLFGGDTLGGGSFAFTDKNVGSGNKTVSASGITLNDGNGGGNYTVSYANNTASSITPAALGVTANAATKTYNGLAYSGGNGVTYTGLVNGETSAVLGGTLAYGGNSQGAVNAGSYLITPGGLTSGNYTLSYVDGALTVNKASLAATITGTPTKVYDGTTAATLAASNYSLSGFVGNEGATVGQTAGAYNSKDVATATTINATLAANNFTATGGTLLANYLLPTTATGAGGITPAGLTVTANALSKTAGNIDPLLTYMTAGLLAPDTTTSTLGGALARLAGETAGVYQINQGSLISLSANYTMSYVPADFGIVAAPVVVPPVVVAPSPVATVLAPVMDTLVNSITVLPPSVPFNPPTPPVITQASAAPPVAPAVSPPTDAAGTAAATPVAAADATQADPKKDAQAVVVAEAVVPVAAPIAAAPLPVCK